MFALSHHLLRYSAFSSRLSISLNCVVVFSRQCRPPYPTARGRASSTLQIPDEECDYFYRYTSGRWLWDEEEQLAARYIKFDIEALCRIAAGSVGSTSCIGMTKLSEGNFNKVLLLSMNDGNEVVAKIPNPNAGRPCFTTASEVATMDFVRNILHIPAPKVYAWCSNPSDTPVGAEYIIMEKISGVKLSQVWEGLPGLKKAEIVSHLARIDKCLVSYPFPAYGSLYYDRDSPGRGISVSTMRGGGAVPSLPGFSVGPTNNRKYFDDCRAALSLDHGPWRSVTEYVTSNAKREQESIAQLSYSPRLQGLFNGPGQYRPSKATKIRALECYLKVAGELLPKVESTHRPVLWHPDLHGENIFVDPKEPTKITGMIDWQSVHLAPLFLQVRRPALIDFDGPIPEPLVAPKLPEIFEHLSDEGKSQAKKLLIEQTLYGLYEIELLQQCKDAGYALQGRDTLVARITGLVGSLFTDGEPIVLGYLMQAEDRWGEIVGQDSEGRPLVPCPIHFTDEERAQQKEDQDKWELGVENLNQIYEMLGAYNSWDGFVPVSEYDSLKQTVVDVRERFLNGVATTDEEREAWRKAWPFPVT